MSDLNTDTIFLHAGLFDLELPPEVVEAQKVDDAAQALLDSIVSETPPDYSTATLKTLAALHQAGVDHERRDDRLKVARDMVKATTDHLNQTKFQAAGRLAPSFAALFHAEGEKFTAALAELGGNIDPRRATSSPQMADAFTRLTSSANQLDMLKGTRAAYAPVGSRADTVNDLFEVTSRCLHVPNRDALYRSRPVGGGAEYWATVVTQGFVIRWQDRAAQEENSRAVAATPSPRPAPAA